jgi:hypothetical protein
MLKHAFFSNDSLRRFGGSLVRFSCCPLPETQERRNRISEAAARLLSPSKTL